MTVASRISKHKVVVETPGAKKAASNLKKVADSEDRISKSSNTMHKQQTRLGRSGESAARSFSAQANGLGGLVAAYAGAAATAYALQAAFDALSRSARFEQTISGLNALAFTSGETGSTVLSTIREITKEQLTMAEAASQASLTLSAGFNLEQIAGLSEVSLKASRALGRDLTDAMTRVVRGSAKMEAELLDELGIYTKIGPATKAYAAAIGKATLDLTEYERRQAFVNSVIAEGSRKFGVISTTIPTASEKLSAFGTKILDIGTQMGSIFSHVFSPLADFLTNNLAGSFVTVGLAISLISSKAVQELSKGLDTISDRIETAAHKWESRFLSFSRSAKSNLAIARESIVGLGTMPTGGIKGIKGDDRELFKKFKESAKEGTLTTSQITKTNALLSRRLEDLTNTRKKELLSIAAKKAKLKDLDKTIKSTNARSREQREQLTKLKEKYDSLSKSLSRARNGLANTRKAMLATKDAQDKLSASSRGVIAFMGRMAGTTVSKFGEAITSAGHFASSLVSLGSSLTMAVSLAIGFGSAIAGLTGKQEEYNAVLEKGYKILQAIFKSSSRKKVNTAALGVAAGTLSVFEQLDPKLAEIEEFSQKEHVLFFDIEMSKTKEDLVREVADAITTATKGQSFWDGVFDLSTWLDSWRTTGLAIAGGITGALTGPAGLAAGVAIGTAAGVAWEASVKKSQALETLGPAQQRELEGKYGKNLFSGESGTQLAVALAQIEKLNGSYKNSSFSANKLYKTQQDILVSLKGQMDNYELLQELAENLGTTVYDIKDTYEVLVDDFNNLVLKPKIAIPSSIDVSIAIIDEQKILDTVSNIEQGLRKTVQIGDTIDTGFFDFSFLTDVGAAAKALETIQKETAVLGRVQSTLEGLSDAERKIRSNTIEKANSAIDKAKQDLLDAGYALGDLDPTVIGKLEHQLIAASDASNNASTSNLSLINTYKELFDLVNSGNATLENLAQNEGVQRASMEKLTQSTQKLRAALAAIEPLREYLKGRVTEGTLASLDDLVANLQNQLQLNNDNIASLEKEKITREKVIQPIKESLLLTQKLKDLMGDLAVPNKFKEDIIDIQGNLLVGETAKQVSLLTLASNTLSDNIASYTTQQTQIQNINKLLEEQSYLGKISQETQQAIATANVKTIDSLLKGVALTDEQVQALKKLVVLTPIQAYDAEKAELAYNSVINTIIKVSKEFKKAIDTSITTSDKAIKHVKDSLREIALDKDLLTLQFKIDMLDLKTQFSEAAQQFKIDKIQADIGLVNAKVSSGSLTKLQGAKKENALQQELLAEKKALITLEYQNNKDKLMQERKLIVAQFLADKEKIKQDIAERKLKVQTDYDLIKAWAQLFEDKFKAEESNIEAMVKAGNSIGKAIYDAVAPLARLLGKPLAPYKPQSAVNIDTTGYDFSGRFSEASRKRIQASAALDNLETAQNDQLTVQYKRSLERNSAEQKLNQQTHDNKMSLAKIAAQTETETAKERLKSAKEISEEEKKAFNELKSVLTDLHNGISGPLKSAIMEINNLVFYGEGNIRDTLSNMFKSIQQNIFDLTIAKPLSRGITDSIFKAIGLPSIGTIEDATVKNGLLQVEVVKDKRLIKQAIEGPEKVSSWVTEFFSKDGVLAKGLTNVFGKDGFFTNIFTGLGGLFKGTGGGGFFSGLFGGILSLFGGAMVGGSVRKMASGGVALRDRIPTMLEPGEFVIRRPAARKAGAPALNHLNATGQMAPNAGNISVNIKNEGSAKEATAAQPKFDGEKYVIDIVTRDLANNGPIRRSLRGNK